MAVPEVDLGELHRLTLDEYHRLVEAGAFVDQERGVELIDGVLVDMSPRTREHEDAVEWLNDWLVHAVDRERYRVRPGSALTLEQTTSEPEPDFAVVPRDVDRPYRPATATLVVEVAVTSRDRDLRRKAVVYALAGIPEYWVLDVQRGRLWVHRRPGPDGYEERVAAGAGETVSAQALVLPPLAVGELLAHAHAGSR